jgi:hypothetical protein
MAVDREQSFSSPRFLHEFARIGKQSEHQEFTSGATLKSSSESGAGEMAMSILFWGLVGLWLLLNGVIAVLLMRRKRSRIDDVQSLPFLVLSQDSAAPRLIGRAECEAVG